MMLITTNTSHIVETPAGAAMSEYKDGLGQTSAFDRVQALAAGCAP